uniref:BZIP domain-containing protein n=1 Tax=Electrophorus electricus TaxID=8005 RepID=A0A4W4G6L2_ELEEL
MAELSPVSDTQALLQSMLQRLKLQTHSGTSMLESTPFALIEGNVRTTESSSETPIYQFGASLETKQQGRIASIYTKPDSPRTFQSSGLKSATQTPPKQPAREIKVHNSGVSTWGFSSERNSGAISSTDVASTPRRIKKQFNFLRRKANEDNSSVPSFPTTDDTLNPPDLSLLSPASATPGYKVSEAQDQEAIWSGTAGNGMGGTISVSESTTQPRTSRKKKRANPGHKRWTQKVKERWRERRNNRDKQEQNEVAKVSFSTFQLHSNNRITKFESMLTFGTINLMEEIFSGQEWAKFFPASTSSRSESSCTTQDQAIESSSSISQLCQEKQTTIRQWDYKDTTESNLNMAPSQMNSGGLHGSNQRAKSMDQYFSHSQNSELTKDQSQFLDHNLSNQSQTDVTQLLSGDHSLNHSDQDHNQSEGMYEEFLPLFDMSYLQPKDSSSLRAHGSLNRKRGHCALSRNVSEQGGSQSGEVNDWREDAFRPVYSPHPDNWTEDTTRPIYSPHLPPSLSPTSFISSLQYSISQDSDLSTNTETVVKKVRQSLIEMRCFTVNKLFIYSHLR